MKQNFSKRCHLSPDNGYFYAHFRCHGVLVRARWREVKVHTLDDFEAFSKVLVPFHSVQLARYVVI